MQLSVGKTMECERSAGDSSSGCCYLCNQCASSFPSLPELEAHLATHTEDGANISAENSPSSSDGSFPYEDVQAVPPGDADTVDSPESEENSSPPRLVVGGRGKLYPCRFCSKLFGSRSLLNIHYTHTHRDKPQYECDDCGRIFSVKRELATHRRIHSGEQTHSCAQCGKEFGTRQLLKKHWMWHTGQRSHVCPHCGKAFFQKGHLTQHLMIHAGGRPHVCQLCSKTFIFKFDLNRHMKIHAERGFSCSKCGKAFLKQATLLDHQTACSGSESVKKEESADAGETNTKDPSVDVTPEASPRQASVPNSPQQLFNPPHRLVCLLCLQEFPSQAAYSVHFSYAHFREAAMHLQQQKMAAANLHTSVPTSGSGIFGSASVSPLLLGDAMFRQSSIGSQDSSPGTNGSLSIWNKLSSYNNSESNNNETEEINSGKFSTGTNGDSDISNATTISEGKSSMQMINHRSEEADSSSATLDLDGAIGQVASNHLIIDESGDNGAIGEHGCSECQSTGVRMREALSRMNDLERALAIKDAEINRLKEKMRRVGAVAGSLLESCSEFDKLWMLHSKKVYSQIQSVLNSLE